MALLHSAIAGLAAERAAIPDYSETLGEIVNRLGVMANRIKRLEASPALGLTPPEIARQIEAAGSEGRREELGALEQATTPLPIQGFQLPSSAARREILLGGPETAALRVSD